MAKPRIHPLTYNCTECNTEAKFRVSKLNLYCSQACQLENQYKERVKEWLVEGKDWKGMIPNWVRRALAEKFRKECSVCGIDQHNGKEITLEVDHIDGIHTNNSIKNLRLICPNCHSQTLTYKNRNKGNGRPLRKM
jgi:5-methylcytosine-specific restriction endonuclease McrA